MTRKSSVDGIESAPRWIVVFLSAYLVLHLLTIYLWSTAGHVFAVQAVSDGTPTLSVTAMAAVGFWLCLLVWRSFPAGAPLRRAWMLIALAVGAQTAAGTLEQLLGTNWVLNPLVWGGHPRFALIAQIRCWALIAGGPVRMALLAAGLLMALRILRKFGFWVRPTTADWAISGIVYLFTLCRFAEAGESSLAGVHIGVADWTSLAGLPFLCLLFIEAMLLRQSVVHMGNGMISKCWAAFMCGIFLTGAGQLALWVIPHYSHSLPLEMLESLAQFATVAVFALAPACQLSAQRRAIKPGGGQPEDLATGVPALAR
jgi:hypothetical protein